MSIRAHSVADEERDGKETKTDEGMPVDGFASTIDVLALKSPPKSVSMDILSVDNKITNENAKEDVELFKGTWMDPSFFPYVPENEVCSPSFKIPDSNRAGAWFYWTQVRVHNSTK
jgi:hypothetical protein